MLEEYNVLKLKILLFFLKNKEMGCNIAGITRAMGVNKQRVSRIVKDLEKDGLIDRSDIRHPTLTAKGEEKAEIYSDRIDISLNHLLYEGVRIESAEHDAYYWALYNSEDTMRIIKSSDTTYRVRYELRDLKKFKGNILCRIIGDGVYHFPFVIYRETVKNGSNYSMANAGFDHPCNLIVKDGIGKIQLRARNLSATSPVNGEQLVTKVEDFKVYNDGIFTSVEKNGDIISFPAENLTFHNFGEQSDRVLQGSVCIKIKTGIPTKYMPESVAILNIFL